MQQETVDIKTDVFEGPLDLLLSLIEKRKLLINDISLAAVADDFISFLEQHTEYPMAKTAYFILVASTLVLIKSKSLLPILTLTEEEQHNVDDLERRLRMHQLFTQVSSTLKPLFKKVMFMSDGVTTEEVVFSPHARINTQSLHEGIRQVITSLPKKKEDTPTAIVKKVMTLEAMIDGLTKRITRTLSESFHEISGYKKGDRAHVIVSFLAILELVKRGILSARQERSFDDITIETEQVQKPTYY